MTSPTRTFFESDPDPESFGGFFENWLRVQDRDLQDLVSAARANESIRSLNELVGRVMSHYENYYRVKSESVKRSVLQMLTPTWRSTLEDAFLWIGGWRPSMAFHLLYSKSGLQLEAGLSKLLSGLITGDLGDLSPSQLTRVDELHRETIKEEKASTETLAAYQETVADSSMVELSHVVTELTRNPDMETRVESLEERLELTLSKKEDRLEEILEKADDLRLRTLKKVVEILSPIQAVHFLIAAAELHLRVHEWGKKKDNEAQAHGSGPHLVPQHFGL